MIDAYFPQAGLPMKKVHFAPPTWYEATNNYKLLQRALSKLGHSSELAYSAAPLVNGSQTALLSLLSLLRRITANVSPQVNYDAQARRADSAGAAAVERINGRAAASSPASCDSRRRLSRSVSSPGSSSESSTPGSIAGSVDGGSTPRSRPRPIVPLPFALEAADLASGVALRALPRLQNLFEKVGNETHDSYKHRGRLRHIRDAIKTLLGQMRQLLESTKRALEDVALDPALNSEAHAAGMRIAVRRTQSCWAELGRTQQAADDILEELGKAERRHPVPQGAFMSGDVDAEGAEAHIGAMKPLSKALRAVSGAIVRLSNGEENIVSEEDRRASERDPNRDMPARPGWQSFQRSEHAPYIRQLANDPFEEGDNFDVIQERSRPGYGMNIPVHMTVAYLRKFHGDSVRVEGDNVFVNLEDVLARGGRQWTTGKAPADLISRDTWRLEDNDALIDEEEVTGKSTLELSSRKLDKLMTRARTMPARTMTSPMSTPSTSGQTTPEKSARNTHFEPAFGAPGGESQTKLPPRPERRTPATAGGSARSHRIAADRPPTPSSSVPSSPRTSSRDLKRPSSSQPPTPRLSLDLARPTLSSMARRPPSPRSSPSNSSLTRSTTPRAVRRHSFSQASPTAGDVTPREVRKPVTSRPTTPRGDEHERECRHSLSQPSTPRISREMVRPKSATSRSPWALASPRTTHMHSGNASPRPPPSPQPRPSADTGATAGNTAIGWGVSMLTPSTQDTLEYAQNTNERLKAAAARRAAADEARQAAAEAIVARKAARVNSALEKALGPRHDSLARKTSEQKRATAERSTGSKASPRPSAPSSPNKTTSSQKSAALSKESDSVAPEEVLADDATAKTSPRAPESVALAAVAAAAAAMVDSGDAESPTTSNEPSPTEASVKRSPASSPMLPITSLSDAAANRTSTSPIWRKALRLFRNRKGNTSAEASTANGNASAEIEPSASAIVGNEPPRHDMSSEATEGADESSAIETQEEVGENVTHERKSADGRSSVESARSSVDEKTRNGHQLSICRNGDWYEGSYRNDKKDGIGVYIFHTGDKFQGRFKRDEMSGYGVYLFNSAGRYEGRWQHGSYNGFGFEVWARGSTYRGAYKEGMRSGYGACRYFQGDLFEGSWLEGKRHGLGMQQCSDDSQYIGTYENGERAGIGTYIFANGDRYAGEYAADVPEGNGVYLHAKSGQVYRGSWKNGKKHGRGTLHVKASGAGSPAKLYVVNFADGMLESSEQVSVSLAPSSSSSPVKVSSPNSKKDYQWAREYISAQEAALAASKIAEVNAARLFAPEGEPQRQLALATKRADETAEKARACADLALTSIRLAPHTVFGYHDQMSNSSRMSRSPSETSLATDDLGDGHGGSDNGNGFGSRSNAKRGMSPSSSFSNLFKSMFQRPH